MPGSEISVEKNPQAQAALSQSCRAAYLALPKKQIVVKLKATGSRGGTEPKESIWPKDCPRLTYFFSNTQVQNNVPRLPLNKTQIKKMSSDFYFLIHFKVGSLDQSLFYGTP